MCCLPKPHLWGGGVTAFVLRPRRPLQYAFSCKIECPKWQRHGGGVCVMIRKNKLAGGGQTGLLLWAG